MDGKPLRLAALLSLAVLPGAELRAQGPGGSIPSTRAVALDGHTVTLPANLSAPATILILGFGRHSQDATTAWEKPVRTREAHAGSVDFYDMAMLAEVPGFVRPLLLRAIKGKVPDVLKPHFLPLTDDEAAWREAAGYVPDQPDAAYVLLVDRAGRIRWTTHAPFSEQGLATLRAQAQALAHTAHPQQ